jgi:Haem-binding domain
MFKKVLLGLGLLFVAAQFYRPARNVSGDNTYDIRTKYEVPADVDHLLSVACNDCHSNTTRYPWYANVQPVAYWLAHHVKEGTQHLNFSTFAKRKVAVQNHKFEEIIEYVESGEMPLASYTYLGLHKEAKLTGEQRQTIVRWAKAQMDTLKARYPADSLVLKRGK